MMKRDRALAPQAYAQPYAVDHFTTFFPAKPWYEQGFEQQVLSEVAYQRLKRLIDLAACIAVLPFVLLILGLCAIAIKLDSPGPVWFTQPRTGKGGRRFKMYKLRTMIENAE